MTLPFLKNKAERQVADEDQPEKIKRKPDENDFDMLDAVVEDLMYAIEKKDKNVLKDALISLITYVQSMDAEQDEEGEVNGNK